MSLIYLLAGLFILLLVNFTNFYIINNNLLSNIQCQRLFLDLCLLPGKHNPQLTSQTHVMNVTYDMIGGLKWIDLLFSQLQCHCWVSGLSGDALPPSLFLNYISLCLHYNKWMCLIKPSLVVLADEVHCGLTPLVVLGMYWQEKQKPIMTFANIFHVVLAVLSLLIKTF